DCFDHMHGWKSPTQACVLRLCLVCVGSFLLSHVTVLRRLLPRLRSDVDRPWSRIVIPAGWRPPGRAASQKLLRGGRLPFAEITCESDFAGVIALDVGLLEVGVAAHVVLAQVQALDLLFIADAKAKDSLDDTAHDEGEDHGESTD